MKCQRPGCQNAAYRWGHGYCRPHSLSTGAAVHRVNATPARNHILTCIHHGATTTGIAAGTGVSNTTVMKLARGEKQHLMPDIHRRLMTATPQMVDRQPAWPIARRIRALRAAGWPINELATHLNISPTALYSLSRDARTTCDGTTANTIRAFYQAHEWDPARQPNSRTARHQWPTPAEWHNIDNPAEDPTVQRIAETTDHTTLVAAVIADHGSQTAAAKHAGVDAGSLSRVIHHGVKLRADVAHRLRTHYCELHNIPTPAVDPIPVPDHLRKSMRRYANDAGIRYLGMLDSAHRTLIPTTSSAAATLGLSADLVRKIIEGGSITPTEYDQACTALGINMRNAA